MQHNIENVEARWPRINRTYKFDANERKSMPCDPLDPLATYDISFRLSKDQARDLWKKMCEAYKAKADPSWPAAPINPFKDDGDGFFTGKAKLKGNYNGELTKKPNQWDAQGKLLPDDFMLTTGSMVNIAVTCVPYNMREAGVSLRLRAVQVLRLEEVEDANPFSTVPGYSGIDTASSPEVEHPFGNTSTQAAQEQNTKAPDFDDEIPF